MLRVCITHSSNAFLENFQTKIGTKIYNNISESRTLNERHTLDHENTGST